jgi:hypothetical protein
LHFMTIMEKCILKHKSIITQKKEAVSLLFFFTL